MTFTIVIVCSANVCRSPLAAALMDRALRGHMVRQHVQIRTCGLAAREGEPACLRIGRLLGDSHDVRQALSEHRSALASPATLEGAGVTLTADRQARAGVVRMFPQAHGRVFTLREAGRLADQLSTEMPSALLGAPASLRGALPDDVESRMRELVSQLDAQRGLGDLVRTERRRTLVAPWHPLEVQGSDVPDAHVDHRVRHPLVLQLVESSVQSLVEAITAFAAPVRRPRPLT